MVTKKNLGLHARLHLELKSCNRQYQLLHRLCLWSLEFTRRPAITFYVCSLRATAELARRRAGKPC